MKLVIFELSLNMSSIRIDQITCQMFFFKHYFSFIFLVFILTFFSCKKLKNEDNDYAKEIEVIRFEKLFFEYDFDSISSLDLQFTPTTKDKVLQNMLWIILKIMQKKMVVYL